GAAAEADHVDAVGLAHLGGLEAGRGGASLRQDPVLRREGARGERRQGGRGGGGGQPLLEGFPGEQGGPAGVPAAGGRGGRAARGRVARTRRRWLAVHQGTPPALEHVGILTGKGLRWGADPCRARPPLKLPGSAGGSVNESRSGFRGRAG